MQKHNERAWRQPQAALLSVAVLAYEHSAGRAVHRRVSLGRVVGGVCNYNFANHQHGALYDTFVLQKHGVPYPMEKSAHRPRDAGPDSALRPTFRRAKFRNWPCKRYRADEYKLLRQNRHGGIRHLCKA